MPKFPGSSIQRHLTLCLPADNRVTPALTPSRPLVTPRFCRGLHTRRCRSSHRDSSPDTAGDSTPDAWKSHRISAFTFAAGTLRSTFSRPRSPSTGRPMQPGKLLSTVVALVPIGASRQEGAVRLLCRSPKADAFGRVSLYLEGNRPEAYA